MSFIAGIIGLGGPLAKPKRSQFLDAFALMKKELPWPAEVVESNRSILVQAGFPHLWQGRKLLSDSRFDAAVSGIQWRKTTYSGSSLSYLAHKLTSRTYEVEDCFDYFACAVFDKEKDLFVLTADPVGICPLLYTLGDQYIVFSNHQTFFSDLFGHDPGINWQAVFEYLLVGHNIGNKTLQKNVSVLPAGCRLTCHGQNTVITRYAKPFATGRERGVDLSHASDIIFTHLERKCQSYSELSNKPVAGFLSGGWDSRLLIAMFDNMDNMAVTYTSQQRTRFQDRLISEKMIAKEVADFIGVRNRFVPPAYRTYKTRDKRARVLDYTTWFHDWAFHLAEKLPYDEYMFCDGLLGDILLRGLYITPDFHECIINKDRDTAIRLLHSRYLRGFNIYTRGIEKWKSVIQPHLLEDFSNRLIKDITEEIYDIPDEDFLTVFLLRNRSRRGVSPLPRLIFGSKGTVVFPFCDYGFLQKVLSLPIELRLNQALYKDLLERTRPGLSAIPSTNSKDCNILKSYLFDSMSELSSDSQFFSKARTMITESRNHRWYNDIIENPPSIFMDLLTTELKNAIMDGNITKLKPFRLLLDKILILDGYLSPKKYN